MYSLLDSKQDGFALDSHRASEKSCVPLQQRCHSVTRNQFPIILAEAMTIHKSQGATFQEAAVELKRNLTRPLQYVALSRVTSTSSWQH
ncbi:hypothetical protein TNCT_735741 [Trichonephila clavata]|uniref:Uncharacterized protein n=1 Tax=Trichonephila clavata TaxID=2740835 RepID=A0A8X6KXG7_TRICU|nr:hypothetical protein TNCT_735741 [Trichonephila clavata]